MLLIGTQKLLHVQKQKYQQEQGQERTRTETVQKVLVAGTDTVSFIQNGSHKITSFQGMKKRPII